MRSNGGNFVQDDATLSVRSGHGLLTGLLRCGRCGRKLHVRYWGRHGTASHYLCLGDFQSGGSYCLGFGGATVDRRLSEHILAVISPQAVEASLVAIAQLNGDGSDKRAALERQLQQARYEAERAFAQYDHAEPGNRLVCEVLERVLSKLGQRMGKGNRWTQARVATVRRKHHIAAPDATDPEILNLAQAQKHTGVSDTTLMRLIRANLLTVQQVAPYAPLEIRRADLDTEPVAGIIGHLKSTGRLVLQRDPSAEQAHLFSTNQSLAQR